MKELPEGLPPLPEGAVYLGKGRDLSNGSYRLAAFFWYPDLGLSWDNIKQNSAIDNTHYAAPADSEIARLNGYGDRLEVVSGCDNAGGHGGQNPGAAHARFHVGKVYRRSDGATEWGDLSSPKDGLITCHDVDEDGSAWSCDIAHKGNYLSDGQGWCFARNKDLCSGLFVEVKDAIPTEAQNAALEELTKIGQAQGDYDPPPKLVIPHHLIDWSRVERYIELGYRLEIDCDGLRGWCHD